MESKWPLKSLEELGVQLLDCVHQTPKEQNVGMPYIGIPQMKNGEIDFKASPRIISQEDFLKWTEKVNPLHGDIVLSRRCNPGETAFVPQNVQFALGQNLVLLRPDPKKLHPGYLRWVVQSPFWWDEVERYRNPGAVFDSLKCADIPKFLVPEPPREMQKSLDSVLLTISEKITLNRQINQTLEQMAQTLFKSWFVDFDPVIDNALDAGNDIPDTLQERAEQRRLLREKADFKPLPAETRALFPSEFEETELGWVPKGWKYHALSEICRELKRGISPKYTEIDGVCVINQKCIRNHEIDFSLARRNDVALKKITGYELEIGDVVVNSTGVGTLGRLAQVKYLPETTVFDSHVTLLRAREEFVPKFFFGQLIQLEEKNIESLGEGSTGQTELSRKILGEQRVLVPPLNVSNKVEKMLVDYASSYVSNTLQTQSLTRLREVLLPKLISGELALDALPEAPELAEAH